LLSLRPRLAIGPLHTSYRYVVLISLFASTARADDIEAARRAFAEGVRLLQDADYEGARRFFSQAEAAHHAPAIVYNLGVTEEHLSHPQAAVDAYDAYLAEVGDAGEFNPTARAAIVQIKARSTRLRISTEPPGARITVDGFLLPSPSPTAFLVPGGRHTVVADAQGWRGEAAVDVTGSGDTLAVVILPSASSPEPRKSEPPTKEPPPGPDGFVSGAAFAVAPYHLFGSSSGPNQRDATQLMAGAVLELGGAITDRFELLGRAFVGIGPEAKPSTGAPFTYAFMGGPGVSFRIGSSVWLGTTFLAGRIETVAHDAAYGTDLVFGAMADAGVAILSTSKGQYVVAVQPGALLASEADNTAFFVPITFGYRAF
jgi:hypothetical protein